VNQVNPAVKPRSKVLPIVITLVSGVLLAGGSCFGFLSTLRFNGGGSSVWPTIFACGFIGGVAAAIVALIWGFVVFLIQLRKGDGN
jgi:hypothetical protein